MHSLLPLLLHRCCYFALDDPYSSLLLPGVVKRSRRPPRITPSSFDTASIGVASTLTVVATLFPNTLNDRLKWLQV